MLFAGVASAQNLTLWLADAEDGDTNIVMDGPSDTAVLQLWMRVPASMRLVNVDAILLNYDAAFGKEVSFEVQGFIDPPPPSPLFGITTRGAGGGPGVDGYQYVGEDANFPLDGTSGVHFDVDTDVLLDEIILHCTGVNEGAPDLIYFGFPPANPGGFQLVFQPLPPPGAWVITQLTQVDLLNGTFDSPITVENLPEPATLGLLLLGGPAALRRR
jgi:hypothetical protein